jgi:hypothetical protein
MVCIATLVGTFAACGNDGVTLGPLTPKSGGSGVAVSADAYTAASLEYQAGLATARCMHRAGYNYTAPKFKDALSADIPFPYGNDDVAFARRYPATVHRLVGGGVNDLSQKEPAPRDNPALKSGSSAGWKEALYGHEPPISYPLPGGAQAQASVGGCTGAGYKKIFGPDIKRWVVASATALFLENEVTAQVAQSSVFKAALSTWRDCVVAAGYRPAGADDRGLTADPTDRRANVANAECGAKNHVVETGKRLEPPVRAALIAQSEAAIIDYNSLVAAAQARLSAASKLG